MNRPWVAHYDRGVLPTLDYPDITVPQLFQQSAELYPDRVATIFHGARLQYREIQQHIDRFATGLRVAGLRRGDRIAIMLPNIPQFIVAFYGALKAGAVVVPTNPLYTQRELEHQLADARASAIVTLDQFFGRVQAALPKTEMGLVIVAGVGSVLPWYARPLYMLRQWRNGVRPVRRGGVVHRFEDLLAATPTEHDDLSKPDDLAVLQYTGGTTGIAKGAMLTHRNLVANALQARNWQGDETLDEARVLCVAPFFHVYGMTIALNLSVSIGATMLLVPRFTPKEIAAVAQKYKPHLFPGVPTIYVALAELPNFSERQFGSLKVCLSGAAPLPPEVQRKFQAVSSVSIVEGYGLTEASPVTHCNPVRNRRDGTVGIPWSDTDAMITDPDTWEPLPTGTIGEMTVSGPQIMKGYWNRPDETASVLRDGWLHTGDLATMDEDGYFRIVDRKKDLIIAGGYNVYPREIEDVLYGHPAVLEASVIGVPDDYRGETIKAVIALKDGVSIDAAAITEYCRGQLAAYKVPKIIEFRSELPKSLTGKVLRRELREEAGSRK